MFSHPDPEVLVVGAGPVGLLAALFLQQDGVRVEILTCVPASGDDLEPLLEQIGLTAAPSGRDAGLGPPPPRSGFGEVTP